MEQSEWVDELRVQLEDHESLVIFYEDPAKAEHQQALITDVMYDSHYDVVRMIVSA